VVGYKRSDDLRWNRLVLIFRISCFAHKKGGPIMIYDTPSIFKPTYLSAPLDRTDSPVLTAGAGSGASTGQDVES
jgi:hypothetical protein